MIKLESKAPQGPLAEKWSKHKAEIKVVSPKSEEICQAILTQMDRGVTLLQGESGYLHRKMQIVLSVVSNRELPRLEKLIRSIDPESFLVISRVSEVKGRGFSLRKDYQSDTSQ